MKTYLVTYEISYDGFEHHDYGIVRATEKTILTRANVWGENFTHEGAGERVTVRSYQEIPPEDEKVIRKYSLAY